MKLPTMRPITSGEFIMLVILAFGVGAFLFFIIGMMLLPDSTY
jgi:hypothetical protein